MGAAKSSYTSHTCCIKVALDFCLKFANANPLFSKFFKFIFIFDHYDMSICMISVTGSSGNITNQLTGGYETQRNSRPVQRLDTY